MMLQGFIHAGQFRIRTRGIIYASATWKKKSAKYCRTNRKGGGDEGRG
jgi:hypothetical protein